MCCKISYIFDTAVPLIEDLECCALPNAMLKDKVHHPVILCTGGTGPENSTIFIYYDDTCWSQNVMAARHLVITCFQTFARSFLPLVTLKVFVLEVNWIQWIFWV